MGGAMRLALLCLVTALVVSFGCGSDRGSVLDLPVVVKHEAREFSSPVDRGGEGDTIAKDGVFIIESTTAAQILLKYSTERNEFHGAVIDGGYFVPPENVTIEVWLSNGIKLEPKPMKKLGKGAHGVVPIAFGAPDVPFESWQARFSYTTRPVW